MSEVQPPLDYHLKFCDAVLMRCIRSEAFILATKDQVDRCDRVVWTLFQDSVYALCGNIHAVWDKGDRHYSIPYLVERSEKEIAFHPGQKSLKQSQLDKVREEVDQFQESDRFLAIKVHRAEWIAHFAFEARDRKKLVSDYNLAFTDVQNALWKGCELFSRLARVVDYEHLDYDEFAVEARNEAKLK